MALLELFLTFMKIGAFTFGGGYAMIAMIQEEAERHSWLTREELVDFVALSESTPGPFAVNMATFVGIRTGGVLGAVIATLGIVLPSFIVILIIAKCFEKYKKKQSGKGFDVGAETCRCRPDRCCVYFRCENCFLTLGTAGICGDIRKLLGAARNIRSDCCAGIQKGTPDQAHIAVCCDRYRSGIRTGTIINSTSVTEIQHRLLYGNFLNEASVDVLQTA